MSIEAMKLALEALENIMLERDLDSATTIARNARYGLRQAIQAAKKQEQDTLAYREAARLAEWLFKKHYAHEEHYASGRVVWELCDTTAGVISQIDNMVCQLVKAEKQEQGEPVAWYHDDFGVVELSRVKRVGWKPLYTTPQQRKPLTDEQIAEISVECATVTPSDIYFARAIEAAHGIKEANNG